jgi:hypothetical protein
VLVLFHPAYFISPVPTISRELSPARHLGRRPMADQQLHTGWSGWVRKISPPTRIRSPNRPARSESLYRLSYPGPPCNRSMNVSRKGTRLTGQEGFTLWVFCHTELRVCSRSVICVECLHRALWRPSSAVRFALNILRNIANKNLTTCALLSGQSVRSYDTHY